MKIKLYANATTTQRTRQLIQESVLPVSSLAKRLDVAESSIRRWKNRETVIDRSHTVHNLATNLSKTEEIIVVEVRKTLLLPLDDLLAITREFINSKVSRSGLNRCLRRYGVNNLKSLYPETGPNSPPKRFKDYDPGYIHVDIKYLPQMPDESKRRYLCAAIDRATRWVHLEVLPDKMAKTARKFLKSVIKATPFHIKTVLTDNGKEFTDRYCNGGKRKPTGNHEFDQECAGNAIQH